jgi:cell division protein ZapA
VTTKKHTLKVTILNEEYTIRSDAPPEHTRAVAHYVDSAIKTVMTNGGVIETNRAVVLTALQIAGELFEARQTIEATNDSIASLSEYVRPLLPPAKRQTPTVAAQR